MYNQAPKIGANIRPQKYYIFGQYLYFLAMKRIKISSISGSRRLLFPNFVYLANLQLIYTA